MIFRLKFNYLIVLRAIFHLNNYLQKINGNAKDVIKWYYFYVIFVFYLGLMCKNN